MPTRDLPAERLATTAQDGARVYLYAADVRGKFRKLRNFVYDALLIFFLILPWIRIGDHPVLLLDIPHRHFSVLGLTFWGHDAPILFLVFALFIVFIGLVTAIFGRGWCGWACPQTVFIDRLFLRVERWIDGDAPARKRLDESPMNAQKAVKRLLKWTIFFLMSLVITHSFLAYFVGTEQIAHMITRPPSENWGAFLAIVITTAVILFDFGWFREQFCIIACPYGRLQSVLMDEHSTIVAYDEKRGEPRRQQGQDRSQSGDCVNCFRCVQVCPTGIDIRRGVQMECIACTACIDACDEVMSKIGKPAGLIRYETEAALDHKKAKPIRTRTVIYFGVILIAAITLFWVVSHRELIKVNFIHAKDNPFQLVNENRDVINHYKISVHNQNTHDIEMDFILPEALKQERISLVVPISPLPVAAGKSVRADLFVTFPREFMKGKSPSAMVLIRSSHPPGAKSEEMTRRIPLVGPGEI